MNAIQVENELEAIEEQRAEALRNLARRVFDADIKPYLIRHGLNFMAGNGDYWINKAGHKRFIDHDELEPTVRQLLDAYVDRLSSLGDWMPNFNFDEYQRRQR